MTETLLNFVEELGSDKNFWTSQGKGKKGGENEKIGSSNIRNMAVLANNADCYEELRLFVEYKIAKGNGWDGKFKGDRIFGHEVLRCMDKIFEMCNRNDREALRNISKFFGYLYWKVYALEKANKPRKTNN